MPDAKIKVSILVHCDNMEYDYKNRCINVICNNIEEYLYFSENATF